MGFLSWQKAIVNPYGLAVIANREFMAAKPALVSQFVKVTAACLLRRCAKTPQPCIDALVEGAGRLDAADQDLVKSRARQRT